MTKYPHEDSRSPGDSPPPVPSRAPWLLWLGLLLASTQSGSTASPDSSSAAVPPPVLTSVTQPFRQEVVYLTNCSLGVIASVPGRPRFPLAYQWQLNGRNLEGATASNYSFPASDSTVGSYSVIVSNAAGSTSATWEVTLTYAGSGLDVGTLAYHLATNAARRAARFTGSDKDTVEYTAPSSTNLDRLTKARWSTNWWLRGVRGLSATPIGFRDALGGAGLPTMVSPRHYLCATHMHPEAHTLAFLDTNNVVRLRTTLQRVDLSRDVLVDISIGILNTDLPPSFAYLPVVPTNLLRYLPTNYHAAVQGIGMNQHFALFSQPMSFWNPARVSWDNRSRIPFGVGTNWGRPLVTGDSSAPALLLIENQLVLLSHNHFPQAGPNYGFHVDAINRQMHYLSTNNHAGTDYQLTLFSLTNWPALR